IKVLKTLYNLKSTSSRIRDKNGMVNVLGTPFKRIRIFGQFVSILCTQPLQLNGSSLISMPYMAANL
ncbi:unnamed protein product, partial [Allacma fusca]